MNFISGGHWYIDTEISLREEFKDDHSNSVILLGPGLLAAKHKMEEYKKKYDKVIILNQAQLKNTVNNPLTKAYIEFIKSGDEVWDYDEYNLETIKALGRLDAKQHILKPCEGLNAGTAKKTIDVLFYGELNEHRQKILNELKKKKVNVRIANGLWGNSLNSLIAQSKICLNIHYYYVSALQEQARMIRWVSSHSNIVSEISRKNYLNVYEVPYEKLVDSCLEILSKN